MWWTQRGLRPRYPFLAGRRGGGKETPTPRTLLALDLATGGVLWETADIARARNTGMKTSEDGTRLLDKGREPILMEPVRATITLRRSGSPKVTLLDHDGLPTGRTLQVKDGAFRIDGAKDCTPYYLVQY